MPKSKKVLNLYVQGGIHMRKKAKGFTLVELMVVIVIIGILAALAIPKFMNASVKAKVSEGPIVLSEFETLELAYLQESNALGDSAEIGWAPPTSKWYFYIDGASRGIGEAEAQAAMGKVADGDKLTVTVASNGNVSKSQAASFNDYLKNFVK
jgi:prepilin-type N-terminal cleavage/methylation domain-containing protein